MPIFSPSEIKHVCYWLMVVARLWTVKVYYTSAKKVYCASAKGPGRSFSGVRVQLGGVAGW